MTAAMTIETRDWRRQAECRNTDPDAFFPAAEVGPAHDEQVAAAKAICAGCPVRTACLEFALNALAHGIAGGLTADERRALRTADAYVDAMGRPIGATRDDTAAVGRAQVAAGRRGRVVEHEFGASRRTVQRWAAQARAARERERDAGEVSHGGNQAPLRTSSSTTPRQGLEPRKESDRSERN